MESHRCLRFTLWSFCVVVDLDADGAESITATYLVHVDPLRTVRVDGNFDPFHAYRGSELTDTL